jgi:hypothetical protein
MLSRPSFTVVGATFAGSVVAALLILAPTDWWLGQLDPIWRAAYALRYAPSFDAPCREVASAATNTSETWRLISNSPRADSVFKELVYSDNIRYPALLYGLAGVYSTDPRFFAEGLPRVSTVTDSVAISLNCVKMRVPVASLIDDLRAGAWTRRLQEPATRR